MPGQQVDLLLVEDNPNDVELTLHAFKQQRLASRVHVVRDGVEALEFLFHTGAYADRADENPLIVLLDLKLPRVDGLEVLRRIRSDARTATIPVVILTSSREMRDVDQGYALGANSYIVKPVDWAQFCDSIRQIGVYWLVLNQPAPAGQPPRTNEPAVPPV